MLVIGGIEKREWFGARHVGQVGEMRQWCFDVVCAAPEVVEAVLK